MKRFPIVLVILMVALWLVLKSTVAPGQILLGAVLAIAIVLIFRNIRPLQPTLRRPLTALRLAVRVLIDIVRSNIAVGKIILGFKRDRELTPGFLDIPLELRDPHGLAVLAVIVTSTPGTVWVNLTPDRATLTLHVLDLQDNEGWIRTIKERYEHPLREIFE